MPASATLVRGDPNQPRSVPPVDFAREWNRPRINLLHDVFVIQA